jgi:ABC-type multidrug transport system fused ATPase/permease subunit
VVVYLAVVQGSLAAGQWLSFGPNIAQAASALKRIRSMRALEDVNTTPSTPLTIEDDEKGIQGPKIELRDVWFKYPTRDIPVLRGLNMTVEKGQFAAIVGPSGIHHSLMMIWSFIYSYIALGCGKTSIISLLERYAMPKISYLRP